MPTHPTWKRKSHIRRIHQSPFRKKQPNFAEYVLTYPPIEASWTIATTTYPFLSAEVQRVIAIYTSTDDLKGFLARLCGGKPQPNPLLQHKLRFIGEEIRKFYGTFASDMIWKSIIDDVVSTLHASATQVFHGYVVYHCSSSRYRLSELNLPNIRADRVGNGVLLNVDGWTSRPAGGIDSFEYSSSE
ncbi:unnamed protein product [Aspergillus oryzae RIB40]|uniref:DNA, SC001 n=1 Tax=Aspergillus oryzae (strain ATCC 42149 / RIB 40) TaxID=510516 RepID=Q2UNS2_ASPOR|nr:unnamed protein product [Aspergillus oryzae RIB40]BAE56793.1 unnamed protein product [Aspergillus oryzae RIB40]